MPWWDKGLKSVKDGAEKVSFEAQKLVRIQREEAVVGDLNNKIEIKTMEIGRLALQLQRSGALADPAVAALAQEIAAMEAQIKQQQEKVAAIKAEQWQAGVEPTAADPSTESVAAPVTAAPAVVAQPIVAAPPVEPVAPVAPPPVETPAAFTTPAEVAPTALTEAFTETPAAPAGDTVVCPNCRTEARSTATFCPECGTRLK